jgi:hypothetical protein
MIIADASSLRPWQILTVWGCSVRGFFPCECIFLPVAKKRGEFHQKQGETMGYLMKSFRSGGCDSA